MSDVKRTIDEDDVARLRAVSVSLSRMQKKKPRSREIAKMVEDVRLVILRLDARRTISPIALEVDALVSDLASEMSELTQAVRAIEHSRY